MTELARLFEEEKVDAVNRAIKEKEKEKVIALKEKEKEKEEALKEKEEEKEEALKEKEEEKNKQFVYNLLNMNMDILDIMKATGLTKAEILDFKNELISDNWKAIEDTIYAHLEPGDLYA